MNYIWGGMIIISIVYSLFTGNTEATVNAAFEGAQSGVTTVLSFAGIMCLWNGLMEAAVRSGLCGWIKKLLRPVIGLIFPRLDKDSTAADYITLNVTGNLLGTGNGATPMGINAIKELSKTAGGKITEAMCVFTVMNTAAFQLMPTSIIALRASAGSAEPGAIVVPIWICSFVALCSAIVFTKFMCKAIYKTES
ncbi:MAG: hypothetical protein IJ300_03875 [Clostridia bacterium]|nr:hypothetical protein [Clostridia bacterium]